MFLRWSGSSLSDGRDRNCTASCTLPIKHGWEIFYSQICLSVIRSCVLCLFSIHLTNMFDNRVSLNCLTNKHSWISLLWLESFALNRQLLIWITHSTLLWGLFKWNKYFQKVGIHLLLWIKNQYEKWFWYRRLIASSYTNFGFLR